MGEDPRDLGHNSPWLPSGIPFFFLRLLFLLYCLAFNDTSLCGVLFLFLFYFFETSSLCMA